MRDKKAARGWRADGQWPLVLRRVLDEAQQQGEEVNREDIIRMAREAGFEIDCCSLEWHDRVERFAVLVAAAEREKVARWQIGSGYTTGHGDTIEDLLVELEWQVREAEREACAKVCDVTITGDEYLTAVINSYADSIRARGQA